MSSLILNHLKSSIDYQVTQAHNRIRASIPSLAKLEVENINETTQVMKTKVSSLLWSLVEVAAGSNPYTWSATLLLGAKTSDDPSSYTVLGLCDELLKQFPVGGSFPIKDYSGALPGTATYGFVYVSSVDLQPSAAEAGNNIRYRLLTCKVMYRG